MSVATTLTRNASSEIRNTKGVVWKVVVLAATMVVCVVFVSLLLTILNSTFGAVAIQNTREPEELLPGRTTLEEMTRAELMGLIDEYLDSGRLVQPFEDFHETDLAYFLVYPRGALRRREVIAFYDWLRAAAAD